MANNQSEKQVARFINGIEKRVSRLEQERSVEAVPNPLRVISDTENSSDSVSTATDTRGDMTWDQDNWDFTEWD